MINFPETPYIGQTYSQSNKNWKWNGFAWDLLNSTIEAFDQSEFNELGVEVSDLYNDFNGHTGNTSNPHNTTSHQVGSYTSGETDVLYNFLKETKLDITGGTIQRGSDNDTDDLLTFKDGTGSTVASVNAIGTGSFKTIIKQNGTSEQYLMGDGSIRKQHKEIITENIDGINVLFSISNVFISNSVSVYLNGIKEIYFIEIDNNKIQFQEAPKNNGFVDLIEVHYLSNE